MLAPGLVPLSKRPGSVSLVWLHSVGFASLPCEDFVFGRVPVCQVLLLVHVSGPFITALSLLATSLPLSPPPRLGMCSCRYEC